LDRAKKVYVFFKKHAIPLVNQSKQPVTVVDCPDYDDALLHLAFGAAKQSFNALIEVQLVSKKMNTQGYQNLLWSGKGLPANIRGEVIEKRDSMGIIEKPQPERISKKKK
ncbi:MAG: hypothetical protein JNK65_07665, partial [Deltaproteobacteria bacterium]|nr:hypothetical protein [Deltaproteobacteria bacterium]